jgi:hypothetical protein
MLIDRDALLERIVYADLSTKTVNALHDLLDAAPTIACERCEQFAYREDLRKRFFGLVAHICSECYCGSNFTPRKEAS